MEQVQIRFYTRVNQRSFYAGSSGIALIANNAGVQMSCDVANTSELIELVSTLLVHIDEQGGEEPLVAKCIAHYFRKKRGVIPDPPG